MWGNRFGWGISALIFVAAIGFAYYLYTLGRPTPPTGDLAAAVKPLTLVAAAKAVLPPPGQLGDAADDYRRAISDFEANKATYEQVAAGTDYNAAAVKRMAGLNDLEAAVPCPTMDLFQSKPAEVVNYDPTVPPLDDLRALGNVAAHVASLAAYDKDYATAEKLGTAVLALGEKLYQERLTYDELSAGIELMGLGSATLRRTAERRDDRPAIAAQTTFDRARLDEDKSAVEPVWKFLSSQGEADIARYAGDYFELADDKNADPVWRVEAVRRIGRLQRNAATHADNVHARRYLDAVAADPAAGPVMHQAAVSARGITSYQNQSQR